MEIKEYIKSLVREIISEDEMDEMSTSGAAGAYSTPYAFKGNKKEDNVATKTAISQGYKKASTALPKNSKMIDYKQLFEGNEIDQLLSIMNTKKAGTEYKKALMDLINLAKKKTGREIWSKKDALQALDYEEPIIREEEIETIQDPKTKEFTKRVKLSDKDEKTIQKIKTLMDKEKINIDKIVKEGLLNEGTYSKFKNEVKLRSKNEQLHKAIKEVKRKLMEIDRIVEYTSMMKQELSEGEEGLKYWKTTTTNVSKIAEMVNELNTKIQNLQQ